MEDTEDDKEPVLLVPPPLTQSSYAILLENNYVARTWHPEGRYGSRTHAHKVEMGAEVEKSQIVTKIGLPLLKSNENIKFIKKCLQERDENIDDDDDSKDSNNVTHTSTSNTGMRMKKKMKMETNEPESSLVQLLSTPGVQLIFKKAIISNRIPKVEFFDATIHPEKIEQDFTIKMKEFVRHIKIKQQTKKNSDGASASASTNTSTSIPSPSKSSFKFCELFAGIGGFGLALEKLGGTCVFASEIYEPSKKIFYSNLDTKHCPKQKIYGDIWNIDAKDIPYHDILVGGFPCQPFSTLGNQPGLDDTKIVSGRKSGGDEHETEGGSKNNDDSTGNGNSDSNGNNGRGLLFTQIVRILRHCQPKAFLLENVQGLVTTANGEALQIIVSSLREVGYDVYTEVISSRGLTVQARKRLFIVGIRSAAQSNSDNKSSEDGSKVNTTGCPFQFPFLPDLGLRASDILHTHEELQYSFNATGIPQNLINLLKEKKDDDANNTKTNTNNAKLFTPASYFQISDAQMDQLRHRSKLWKPAKLAWDDKTCDVIDSHYGISVGKGNSQLVPSPAPSHPRRFTPRECARVMGFSNSFILGEFDVQRFRPGSGSSSEDVQPKFNGYIKEQYYMLGNAVCPPVISVLAGAILDQVVKYEANTNKNSPDALMETQTWLERGLWSGIQLALDAVNPQKLSEVCDRLYSQFSS